MLLTLWEIVVDVGKRTEYHHLFQEVGECTMDAQKWRLPNGKWDFVLAMTVMCPAVLTLGCFGACAYLLDYYYAHVVVSRIVCFPSCLDLFQEGSCFCKRMQQALCVCLDEI